MDKALEKLGIYDILGIWLSGAISLISLYLLNKYVYMWNLCINLPYKEFIFIIFAYFIGIVLQEIGNLLQMRLFNKDGKYIKNILQEASKKTKLLSYTYLSDEEFMGIEKFFSANYGDNCDAYTKYYYCRHNLPNGYDNSEHNQSMAIGALSRSLSISFGIFLVIGIIDIIVHEFSFARLWAVLFCLIMVILLWNRSNRMLKMRYEKVFRAFYYSKISGK